MLTINLEKVDKGYRIEGPDGTNDAKDLRELKLITRSYGAGPSEWAKLREEVLSTGKASFPKSFGNLSRAKEFV